MKEETSKTMLHDWKLALADVFKNALPAMARWDTVEDIAAVLNAVGSKRNANHMFYPNQGGLDLDGAKLSRERGAIELNAMGTTVVVLPTSLTFNSFGMNMPEWSYFRLECDGLERSGVDDGQGDFWEEITEISPGNYVVRRAWESGYYGHNEDGVEIPLPKGARLVTRFMKGAFVIFSKGSIYNRVTSTYDGRHTEMTADEFYQYIKRSIDNEKDR